MEADIGYGSSATPAAVKQWEKAFGPVNARYLIGGHLFVVVNSMTLDDSETVLQKQTWEFVEDCAEHSKRAGLPVILATHIPLHKKATARGCDPVVIRRERDGIIKEQTHLTQESSQQILRTLRPKMIFTGHDHNGCFWNHSGGILEYTVRSVMGDFGGAAKLLAIKKGEKGEYKYSITDCSMKVRMRDIFLAAVVTSVWLVAVIVGFINRFIFTRGPAGVSKEKKAKKPEKKEEEKKPEPAHAEVEKKPKKKEQKDQAKPKKQKQK